MNEEELHESESPEVEIDPQEDINSPLYHAPNACTDPLCLFPQCDDDGGTGEDKFPGEDIWWKTNDNWKKV